MTISVELSARNTMTRDEVLTAVDDWLGNGDIQDSIRDHFVSYPYECDDDTEVTTDGEVKLSDG